MSSKGDGRKRVLIVDDERDYLAFLSERLEYEGYDVDVAEDGIEGVEKARSFKPDLILLDIMMPKMDGYAVKKEMNGDAALRDIPVIFLTAWDVSFDDEQKKIIADTMCIPKPFEVPHLLKAMKECIG